MKNLFKFRGFAALAAVLAIFVSMFLPVCSIEVHLTEQSADHLQEISDGAAKATPNASLSLEKFMTDVKTSLELSDKYTDDDRKEMETKILEIEDGRKDKKIALAAALVEFSLDKRILADYNSKIDSGKTLTEEELEEMAALTARIEELETFIQGEFKTTDMKDQNEISELVAKISETKGYTVKFSFFSALVNIKGVINSVKLLASTLTRDNALKKIEEIEEEIRKNGGKATSQNETNLKEAKETLEKAMSVIEDEKNYKSINAESLSAALLFEKMQIIASRYTNVSTITKGFSNIYDEMYDLAYEATETRSWAPGVGVIILYVLGLLFGVISMITGIIAGIVALTNLRLLSDMEEFSSYVAPNCQASVLALGAMFMAIVFLQGAASIGITITTIVLAIAAVYDIVTFFLSEYFGRLTPNERSRFIVSLARKLILLVLGFIAMTIHVNADKIESGNTLYFAELKVRGGGDGGWSLLWAFLSIFYVIVSSNLVVTMLAAIGGIGNKKDVTRKSDSTLVVGIFALIIACIPLVVNAIVPCLFEARFTEMVLFCVIFAVCVGFKIAESTFGVARTRAAELMEYSVYPEKKFTVEAPSADNA